MNESIAELLVGLLVGAAVGAAFFLGLWRTVRALPAARRPATLFVASFVARLALVVAAFVLLATEAAGPFAVLGGALGFLATRVVLVRRIGRPLPTGADSRGH